MFTITAATFYYCTLLLIQCHRDPRAASAKAAPATASRQSFVGPKSALLNLVQQFPVPLPTGRCSMRPVCCTGWSECHTSATNSHSLNAHSCIHRKLTRFACLRNFTVSVSIIGLCFSHHQIPKVSGCIAGQIGLAHFTAVISAALLQYVQSSSLQLGHCSSTAALCNCQGSRRTLRRSRPWGYAPGDDKREAEQAPAYITLV